MKTPGIRITRYPYEEPYHLNLQIEASNGRLHSELEYYCNADDLKKFGEQLAKFSGRRNEEVIYELGSENSKNRFAFFLSIRAKPIDSCGHCALRIRLNNNEEEPNKEVSEFFVKANVADLNRFGKLLVGFGRLQHHVLEWQVQDGRLIEEDEEVV
jgi:hypothetical protein